MYQDFVGIDVPIWLILGSLMIYLLYLYGTWPYSFFTDLGIPGPKPLPFIGNFVEFFTKAELENETKWVKQYGKIYGYFTGRQPVLCIHDQKLIETIMVTDFSKYCNREGDTPINPPMDQSLIFLKGDHWRRVRNIVLPTFSSGKLRGMTDVIKTCGRQLQDRFESYAKNGRSVNLKDMFGSYALEVISATAFGLKVDSQQNKEDPFLRNVEKVFEMNIPYTYLIYKTFPFLRGINDYLGYGIWPKESIDFLSKSIKETVQDRKANPLLRNDFLQLLIDAESTEETHKGGQKKLSQDELIAQSFLLFVAGFETTATLMTYMGYNLSRYPDIQEKVYQEMKNVLGDAEPTYELISKLTYLEQCLNETLRMFPPIQSMTRVTQEEVVLGGYRIPRDTAIKLPFRYIQMDPEIYPEPEVFNPDRFAPEKRTTSKPIFMPFGIGPRKCLGNRLALLEAKIALAYVLRKYYFVPSSDFTDGNKVLPGPILTTVTPIKVQLKARH